MPEIDIPENLYRQIEAESNGVDFDETLWRMVSSYRRMNNPESDRS